MEQGILVLVAAGNAGPAAYTVGSPGCAQQVITVGACDEMGHVASFSSRGPTGDGRVKPDLVAPGVEIVAARAANTSMGTVVSKYYTAASGTSMATPLVAGLCGLLLEAEPELNPLEIKERLMDTAVSLGASGYAQGDGRVDAWRARHNQVQPEEPEPTPPPTGPVTPTGCLTTAAGLWAKLKTRFRS
jgi:serine protease AprX